MLFLMVSKISAGYNSTPYHNFGHAACLHEQFRAAGGIESEIYPRGEGGDAFSAIIHDLGHEGVPNAQLVKRIILWLPSIT